MKLPVGLLKGLGDPLHGVNDLQTAKQLHVYTAGIANETKNSCMGTFRNMNIQVHFLKPADQVFGLFSGSAALEDCYHVYHLLKIKSTARERSCAVLGLQIKALHKNDCSTNRYYLFEAKK
jgi:hypothetical protein